MKRKGFTLLELLIVIVVIGILAVMMLFSSTEAVTTAKASNIAANLTHIRKAVIMWYCDNRERITYIPTDKKNNTDLKFYFNDIKYNSIQDALSGKPHSTNDKNHKNYNQTVSFLSYMDGLGGINEKVILHNMHGLILQTADTE